MCPATGRHRRRLVGAGGTAPPSRACHARGLLLTYAPWSGPPDVRRPAPVPQTGGSLSSPGPGRSPPGQPLVAYPRFLFGLVVQTDFSPSTVAEEVRGQNLVRCEGDPILEGPVGVEPTHSGPQPEVQNRYTLAPKIGRRVGNRTLVFRLSTECSATELHAVGATGGIRIRVIHSGKVAPCFSATVANIGWGGGNRTPILGFKARCPATGRRPNNGGCWRSRTSRPIPPLLFRDNGFTDRRVDQPPWIRGELNAHFRLARAASFHWTTDPKDWWSQPELRRHLPHAKRALC